MSGVLPDRLGERRKTVVSILQLPDTVNEKKLKRERDILYMFNRLLSSIYTIIIILIGTLFPMAEAMNDTWLDTHYNGVFLIYLYVVGTVFLVYLQWFVIPASKKKMVESEKEKMKNEFNMKIGTVPNPESPSQSVFTTSQQLNGTYTGNDVTSQKRFSSRSGSVTSLSSVALVSDSTEGQKTSWVNMDGLKELFAHEGSSIYLRFGALVFGIGNIIYIGLEIEYYTLSDSLWCETAMYGWTFILRLIFTLVQTFFLLKYAKVHVCVHVNITRWGFMHVIATNIRVWISALISEITHSVHLSHVDHGHVTTPTPDTSQSYISGFADSTDNCSFERSLLSKASPYLFPFVSEYSLIAAGIVAIMTVELSHTNPQELLNKMENILKANKEKKSSNSSSKKFWKRSSKNSSSQISMETEISDEPIRYVGPMYTHPGEISFESSHKGMFCGVLLLTGIIISMVLFLSDTNVSQESYLISDLCLHSIMLVTSVMSLYSLNKLHISLTPLSVDDILLLVSMAGSFMFELSIILSTAFWLSQDLVTPDNKKYTILSLCCSLVASTQTIVQAILLITGLRRYTKMGDATEKIKPGREAITFLIVANVTTWMFRIIQVKELELGIEEDFYGTLTWLFLLNLNLPLLLFFRFHSSVCFADIWIEAYKPMDHSAVLSDEPPVGLTPVPSSPHFNSTGFDNKMFYFGDESLEGEVKSGEFEEQSARL